MVTLSARTPRSDCLAKLKQKKKTAAAAEDKFLNLAPGGQANASYGVDARVGAWPAETYAGVS